MNKKIASEIAIGIILLVVIIVGGIFWLQQNKQTSGAQPAVITQTEQVKSAVQTQSATQPVATQTATSDISVDKNANQQISEEELKNLVSSAVSADHSIWDKKVTIDSYNSNKTAVKGKWWAKDAWDWIAWQQNNGQWAVFANFEGATASECNLLKNVPAEYKTFFQNIVNDPIINSCLKK